MRHNSANLVTLPVLSAPVNETACRSPFLILQGVPGKCGGQQPLTCKRKRNAAGVHCDPSSSPLLSHVCGGAASAGGVNNEVARIGCHENAALDYFRRSLHYVNARLVKAAYNCICPHVRIFSPRIIRSITLVSQRVFGSEQSVRMREPLHAICVRF